MPWKKIKCFLGLHRYKILKKSLSGNVFRAHIACNNCNREFYGMALDSEKNIGFVAKMTPEYSIILKQHKAFFNPQQG